MTSTLVATLMLIGFVTMLAGIAAAIARNIIVARRFRRELGTRLGALRLGRALALAGLDPRAYLHTERTVDIERHMQACRTCTETARCDEALSGHGGPLPPDSCPNSTVFKDLHRTPN